MNQKNSHILQCAIELEKMLKSRGAEGNGLGELAISFREHLPQKIMDDIMNLARFRNRIVHEDIDIEISERNYKKMVQSYERVMIYLERGWVEVNKPQKPSSPSERRAIDVRNWIIISIILLIYASPYIFALLMFVYHAYIRPIFE